MAKPKQKENHKSSARKDMYQVQRSINMIKKGFLIRNHEGQKSMGWHIQSAEIKYLLTKNSIS